MGNPMIIILLASYNIASLIILFRFSGHIFKKKRLSNFLRGLITILIMIVSININEVFSDILISLALGITVYSIAIVLLFEGKLHVKLIASFFYFMFSFFSELLAALLMTMIFGNILLEVRYNTLYMFLGALLSKIILMIIVETIFHFRTRNASNISISSWLMIISIPIVSVALSVVSVYDKIIKDSFSITSGLTCLSILYINIIAFYLFDSLIVQIDHNGQFKIRENVMKLQQEQYKAVIDGYDQVKKVRHDMNNHLVTIGAYLRDCMGEYAIQYINKLSSELDLGKRGVLSGNVVVDAIINNKKTMIEKNDIAFTHDIIVPSSLKLSDIDLSIVLGNLVNNAIEACKRMGEDPTKISLVMKYKHNCLLIDVRNTYDKTTIRMLDGKFISSKLLRKKNEVGIGLHNISDIVEKYNGAFTTEKNEFNFISKVMIPDEIG